MRRTKEMTTPQKERPFEHKRSLGQNFLTSDVVPKWLCEAGSLKKGDIVLEIGPGTGILTKELLARGHTVIAIEADRRAVDYLQEEFVHYVANGQLQLHHTDARTIEPASFGLVDHEFVVISNIPYYLSGLLLRRLLESTVQPKTLVFLMQKELVARIAKDQKESLISLSVKAFGEPVYVKTVSRGHFFPIPKVDSAILAIHHISRDRLSQLDPTFFFTCLHQGLGSKRKQLITNLSHTYKREDLERHFTEKGIPLTVRGEDLSLEDWVDLCLYLKNHST